VILIISGYLFAQKPVHLQCEHLNDPLGVDIDAPRLSWQMDDSRLGAKQMAYQVWVGTDSARVARGEGSMWNSLKVHDDRMLVIYEGKPLLPFTRYFWGVKLWDADNRETRMAISSFETGMKQMQNWQGAWISDGPSFELNTQDVKPAPCFRKEFIAKKQIKEARAYIAVAGLFEFYINGQRVGNHRLDPMFTNYDRRVLYVTHDVTALLQQGNNAMGILLGNGWYNHQSNAVWFFHRAPWRDRPTFCLDLRITYEDGSVETISSDESWKSTLSSVIFNSIYTAEHHDNRLLQPDWYLPEFNDSMWKNPVIFRAAPAEHIVSQQLYPIRNVNKIVPKSFKKISNQHYIYNFGQNISGVTRLVVSGETGTEIHLKHAEIMRPGDVIYMNNVSEHYRPLDDSDPFGEDIFILNGKGEETFIPYFNYKGFQYVEVTSDKPINLTQESLTAYFMHSDVPPVGQVKTSNLLINRMWWAANNSYLSNLFGYPTDCPHREKNGWTGDANLAVEMGLFNFDALTIYEKWLADHRDAQQPNGVLPAIIPSSGWGFEWANGVDWTGSIAIIPWAIYEFYGDSRLLSDCYDNIKRYMNHVERVSPDGICAWGLGDWISVKASTPQMYTSTVYYYRLATIMSKTAKLFNKQDDEKHYVALAEKIKKAFNDKYLNTETAIYNNGTQTEMSTALCWGLVPEHLQQKVADQLAKRIREVDNGHLNLGMLGTKAIWHALSEHGYADLAYEIASQTTYPSLGYFIVKDSATTLYEQWEAIGERRESSLNHIMYGEVSAWFFRTLGGINPDPEKPGFKNTLLKPHFVSGLSHAEVSFNSPYGQIFSKWERQRNNKIHYKVVIPANATADFRVPEGYTLVKIAPLVDTSTDRQIKLEAGTYNMELKKK
jgi:alpha-L-rhamnosidase